MYCSNCGLKVEDGSRFCPGCGNALVSVAPAAPGAAGNGAGFTPLQAENIQAVSPAPLQAENVQGASPTPLQAETIRPAAPAQTIINNNEYNKTIEKKIVKKSHGRGLITVLLILVLLVGGLIGYGKFIVKGPDKVAEQFMSATGKMDIEALIDCLDSKSAQQYSAMLGLVGSLTNWIVGFDGMDSLVTLSPFLAEMDGITTDFDINHCETEYEGGLMEGFRNVIGLEGLNKLFAERALVTITVKANGKEVIGDLMLVNEGFGNWKVDGQSMMGR